MAEEPLEYPPDVDNRCRAGPAGGVRAFGDAHAHPSAHSHSDSHPGANADAGAHRDSYGDAGPHSHPHSNLEAGRDPKAYTYAHAGASHSDAYPDQACPNGYAYPNSYARPHRAAAAWRQPEDADLA